MLGREKSDQREVMGGNVNIGVGGGCDAGDSAERMTNPRPPSGGFPRAARFHDWLTRGQSIRGMLSAKASPEDLRDSVRSACLALLWVHLPAAVLLGCTEGVTPGRKPSRISLLRERGRRFHPESWQSQSWAPKKSRGTVTLCLLLTLATPLGDYQ